MPNAAGECNSGRAAKHRANRPKTEIFRGNRLIPVAWMERSAIRGNLDVPVPDFAHRARIRATRGSIRATRRFPI
jgi:hypothetical protein